MLQYCIRHFTPVFACEVRRQSFGLIVSRKSHNNIPWTQYLRQVICVKSYQHFLFFFRRSPHRTTFSDKCLRLVRFLITNDVLTSQHTRIAFAFACWNFLSVLNKCDSCTRMLQLLVYPEYTSGSWNKTSPTCLQTLANTIPTESLRCDSLNGVCDDKQNCLPLTFPNFTLQGIYKSYSWHQDAFPTNFLSVHC